MKNSQIFKSRKRRGKNGIKKRIKLSKARKNCLSQFYKGLTKKMKIQEYSANKLSSMLEARLNLVFTAEEYQESSIKLLKKIEVVNFFILF